MDLVLQFINFVVGSLVEIYNNRAAYEAKKAAINQAWEQHFEEAQAAQAQAEVKILEEFDAQLAEAVKKSNNRAVVIAVVIILVAILIAVALKYKSKTK